jgi:eukaryotic-like serine/threonine-protein kinase
MPAPATTDELLELIRKSELILPQRLGAFVEQVRVSAAANTPRELVGLLIAAGLVTQFQAEQFLQGKWRGFTIGKYKVLERLGSGGMGTVYLCEHMQVGRRVAVKVLPNSQAHNPSALGRFYREGRAAGVLDHPNLVKAHDIDQEGGLHFLVMDYVDGSSLQHIVVRFGALPPPRAAHYVRQAANGLQHAYQAGLLHRDVKPANIMLERNGAIRLLDLGLARFYHDNTDLLTLQYDDRNVLGTADYVSPEQALNSHEVDIRTDVYSLGATFYFLLTGQPPFPDGKIAQKLIWHQVRQPTPVRQVRPEVPEGLSAIVEKMMAKTPAQRYQTPLEVVEALRPWTTEPVAPPREEEMPRLSPAVAPTVPTTANRQSGPVLVKRQPNPAGPESRLAERSGRVVTLDRPPTNADVGTPRVLSSTPTPTAQPRLSPVAPSRLLERTGQQFANARDSGRGSATLLALLALVSASMGVALTWWFVGR